MTLRVRLAAAFFVVVLGPAVLGALFLAIAASASGPPPAQTRLDHGALAVRAAIAVECDRLAATAAAQAMQAAAQSRPVVAAPEAPGPWAMCGDAPVASGPVPGGNEAGSATAPSTIVPGPGIGPESLTAARYGALAARAEIRGPDGGHTGYAYAATSLGDDFMGRLAAVAGVTVTLRSPPPASSPRLLREDTNTRWLVPDPGQPLPLALTVTPAETVGRYPVTLAATLTAGLAASTLAWWLAGAATRPLGAIIGAVERVAAGHHDVRARLSGRDELGRLSASVNRLINQIQQAQRLSVTDALTGLWNVRHLNESLRLEVERASRFGRALGVLVLDLDHFKEVNDRYGHRAGDAVLAEFAHRIRGVVREVDLAFRQGGEEFVVLLPETDVAGSATVAHRLGAAVRGRPFAVGPRRGIVDEDLHDASGHRAVEPRQLAIPITVSIGVAVYPDHAGTGAEVLDAADEALYAAKAAGRDTCILATARLPRQRVPAAAVDKAGASGGTAPPPSSLAG